MPRVARTSDLEDHLGYWLRRVSNSVSQAFARELAARETTVAEWVLLRLLHGEGAVSPARLAERMGMTKGAITKLVDRLESRSLVIRRADAEDGRAQAVALTPRGRAFVPELASLADRNDARCFGSLSARDQAALRRILRGLSADLGTRIIPTE